ncbi:hypothetical protein HPG69_009257 [Diceros bicornis minor]|uniref:DnaJ homolog subfamily C member 12 n=1 Tax=Diceros bicornis minor TaxID=77932 RepID=A0A7J7FIW3_DICBM|nr:hypothetical protein HPG69_009257 [Diceros bicornis minor]
MGRSFLLNSDSENKCGDIKMRKITSNGVQTCNIMCCTMIPVEGVVQKIQQLDLPIRMDSGQDTCERGSSKHQSIVLNVLRVEKGRKAELVISMDAILNYRSEDTEDYYTLLGCDELSSVEQILAEFKVRALEYHPDKHPENSKAVETFQKLQKAKEILTNEESRARYDHWRRSQVSMPFQQWEALSDSSMHWAVRSKKDLMLEESDQTHTNKVENEEGNEQREIKKEELDSTTEKMEQKDSESLEKSFSPQNPDSPGSSDENRWHLHFRWSADAPSELLRKFRNYEI